MTLLLNPMAPRTRRRRTQILCYLAAPKSMLCTEEASFPQLQKQWQLALEECTKCCHGRAIGFGMFRNPGFELLGGPGGGENI